MARNFAQILFLLYALFLLSRGTKGMRFFLALKGKKRALRALRGKNLFERVTFRSLKYAFPPVLYHLNFAACLLFALAFFLQILLGWADFMAIPTKILTSLILVLAGANAMIFSAVQNTVFYGAPFVLYRENDRAGEPEPGQKPVNDRAFSSSLFDAFLFVALPLVFLFCNIFAL